MKEGDEEEEMRKDKELTYTVHSLEAAGLPADGDQ